VGANPSFGLFVFFLTSSSAHPTSPSIHLYPVPSFYFLLPTKYPSNPLRKNQNQKKKTMPSHFLASHPGVTLAAAQRIAALAPYLTPSVTINLGLGGYHLMMGLLLGVVKYQQIHASKTYTAHPYISTGISTLWFVRIICQFVRIDPLRRIVEHVF
jgi:hypothetical protein